MSCITLNTFLPKGLPAGTRMRLFDNTNLTVPVGTLVTLSFNNDGENPICVIDGDNGCASMLPLNQMEVIGMSQKKVYKERRGELTPRSLLC